MFRLSETNGNQVKSNFSEGFYLVFFSLNRLGLRVPFIRTGEIREKPMKRVTENFVRIQVQREKVAEIMRQGDELKKGKREK